MAETYTPPLAELPPWLSYSLVPILTTTRVFTVATLLPNGEPTLLPTSILQTIYTTEVIQLALTVDVGGGVPLGWPYTTAGGTGPTIASVLGGAAGREFTIGDITVLAGVTRTASIGRTSVDETTRATSTSAAGASSSSRAQSLPPSRSESTSSTSRAAAPAITALPAAQSTTSRPSTSTTARPPSIIFPTAPVAGSSSFPSSPNQLPPPSPTSLQASTSAPADASPSSLTMSRGSQLSTGVETLTSVDSDGATFVTTVPTTYSVASSPSLFPPTVGTSTLPNGSLTTFTTSHQLPASITSTASEGETAISTLPNGSLTTIVSTPSTAATTPMTTPTVSTLPNGSITTLVPSSTSSLPPATLPPTSSSHLTKADAAGVILGSIIAFLLLLLLTTFIHRRFGRSRTASGHVPLTGDANTSGHPRWSFIGPSAAAVAVGGGAGAMGRRGSRATMLSVPVSRFSDSGSGSHSARCWGLFQRLPLGPPEHEGDADGEGVGRMQEMGERPGPMRTRFGGPLYSIPPSTPPRSPLRRAFGERRALLEEGDEESQTPPRTGSARGWERAVEATGALASLQKRGNEDGYSEGTSAPTSPAIRQARGVPRVGLEPATPTPIRTRKIGPMVSEMGWLRGDVSSLQPGGTATTTSGSGSGEEGTWSRSGSGSGTGSGASSEGSPNPSDIFFRPTGYQPQPAPARSVPQYLRPLQTIPDSPFRFNNSRTSSLAPSTPQSESHYSPTPLLPPIEAGEWSPGFLGRLAGRLDGLGLGDRDDEERVGLYCPDSPRDSPTSERRGKRQRLPSNRTDASYRTASDYQDAVEDSDPFYNVPAPPPRPPKFRVKRSSLASIGTLGQPVNRDVFSPSLAAPELESDPSSGSQQQSSPSTDQHPTSPSSPAPVLFHNSPGKHNTLGRIGSQGSFGRLLGGSPTRMDARSGSGESERYATSSSGTDSRGSHRSLPPRVHI